MINQNIAVRCNTLKLKFKKNIGEVDRMEAAFDFKLLSPFVNPLEIDSRLIIVIVLEMIEMIWIFPEYRKFVFNAYMI